MASVQAPPKRINPSTTLGANSSQAAPAPVQTSTPQGQLTPGENPIGGQGSSGATPIYNAQGQRQGTAPAPSNVGGSSFWASWSKDLLGAVGLAPSLFTGGGAASGSSAAGDANAAPTFTASEQWNNYNFNSPTPAPSPGIPVSPGLLPSDIPGAGPSSVSSVSTPGGATLSPETPAPAPGVQATPADEGTASSPTTQNSASAAPGSSGGPVIVPPSDVYGAPNPPPSSFDLWGLLKTLFGLATPFIVPFLKNLFASAPGGVAAGVGAGGGSGGGEGAAGGGDLVGDAGPLAAFKRLPPLAKIAVIVVVGTLGAIAARKMLKKG
jgi:hypothetical protein